MGAISLATKGVLCFGNTVRIIPVENLDIDVDVNCPVLEVCLEDVKFDLEIVDIKIDVTIEDL